MIYDKNVIDEFLSPGHQFRGKPFWAWNGVLDLAESREQVRLFKEMGLGGFFMSQELKPYAEAMIAVAKEKAVFLVDLYTPSGTLFDRLGDADHTREKERC